MDFYKIKEHVLKNGTVEIYPSFINMPSKDLMVKGGSFYAIWNEKKGLWTTDKYEVITIIDGELEEYYKKRKEYSNNDCVIKRLSDTDNDRWEKFNVKFIKYLPDNFKQLDTKVTFANDEVKKTDYVSKRVPYDLAPGDYSAYDELMNVLYSPEEREKLEWAIGSIVAGESKKIHKFFVLYGGPKTGKSTFINILQELFEGYWTSFDAKSLGNVNDQFAMESLRTNPLIAIQHDGDLSRIEDNTRINSLVSHETQTMKEKFKQAYQMSFNCMMFIGTNKPVKITDSKSGIKRRLIDVSPTGKTVSKTKYDQLTGEIKFELGAIAYHCLEVYRELGPKYYDSYEPLKMEEVTNPLYFFLNENKYEFKDSEWIPLTTLWDMYKKFCEDSAIQFKLNKTAFKEELYSYFEKFSEDEYYYDNVVGKRVHNRNCFGGFKYDMFKEKRGTKQKLEKPQYKFVLKEQHSLLDDYCADMPAQYTKEDGNGPQYSWSKCTTILKDIDTSKEHWINVPENLIVIDFDIQDAEGNKLLEENLKLADKFPETYAEVSKSGGGLHLHYIYDGDVNELEKMYDEHIEIKVYKGKSALRRKLTKCNDIPIATINSGLPLKKKKGETMVNFDAIKSENGLRRMIVRNLNKEIHGATKPSIDFIVKILDDAYNSGMTYDVTDMRQAIMTLAANSTHQADACIKAVTKMKFQSEDTIVNSEDYKEDIIIFFDVEVFPNLFIICWKKLGGENVVRMINPKAYEVEELLKYKLVGFNCRRYDNHIMYAASMGYSPAELYKLSQKIINAEKGVKNDGFFAGAYNLSYTDIYDYSKDKQSLKKWEIQLGIHHQENSYPWDEPLDESHWDEVADYCCNDVLATEAVWNATQSDFRAREILVKIAQNVGAEACVNDTTNSLTTKIIFGKEKHPELVYTHLEETFPGYEFVKLEDGQFHNMYMGEDAGFGGYVYDEPGIYYNVALLDIASMHPASIIAMNCFGDYTKNFKDIRDVRVAIKHKDFDKAKKMLNGALKDYLDDEEMAEELSTALKIPINSVYGLTSAKFDNPFRDVRNVNNIVALRGALFMITLKNELIKRGTPAIHFKTDSLKIPNADKKTIDFVMEFGEKYGYTFEHEATYEKMCLTNGSTYISKYLSKEKCQHLYGYIPTKQKEFKWTATAAQFQHPYVFKTLFSHEELEFADYCETKEVSRGGVLYLDFNEDMGEEEHNYRFIGKVGLFVPVKAGTGGGLLMRGKDDKYYSVAGTKGYRWKEAEIIRDNDLHDEIDMSYYEKLDKEAIKAIEEYGDFYEFSENLKENKYE